MPNADRVLLDTHAWVWWVSEPDRLSDAARDAIDGALKDRLLRSYDPLPTIW